MSRKKKRTKSKRASVRAPLSHLHKGLAALAGVVHECKEEHANKGLQNEIESESESERR